MEFCNGCNGQESVEAGVETFGLFIARVRPALDESVDAASNINHMDLPADPATDQEIAEVKERTATSFGVLTELELAYNTLLEQLDHPATPMECRASPVGCKKAEAFRNFVHAQIRITRGYKRG